LPSYSTRDALVAVGAFAVGDVDVAIALIDEDARGMRRCGGRIQRLTLWRTVGKIDHALLADLQQHLAAVMSVFSESFRTARRRSRCCLSLVDVTGVQAGIEQLRIAPGIDDVAGRIELDDRRRELAAV